MLFRSVAELIIREGQPVKLLDPKAPLKLNIAGTIGTVLEFLKKRVTYPNQVPEGNCMIIVNREEISIVLITNEHDDYLKGRIIGVLEVNSKFKEFGINTGKVWTPTVLALFFKMNRPFFTSKDDNMKLVTLLMNFTATINNSIDRLARENGDRTDKFAQTVESNLPKSFMLKIPIFKGCEAETIEVETFAQINGRDVSFTLLSPAAVEIEEHLRNTVIDSQLEEIKMLAPFIPIIEE